MHLGEIAARGRALWRVITRGRELDGEMDKEMRFHMEGHAERLIPGLKVTGGQMLVHLRELSGGTKARLGRTWTFLIVAQVAVAVTVLPLALYIVWQVMHTEVADAGFAVERYFVGEVAVRDESRLHLQLQEFMDRLKRVPDVAGVTFSASIPGDVGAFRRVEFDRSTSATGTLAEDAERRSAGISGSM